MIIKIKTSVTKMVMPDYMEIILNLKGFNLDKQKAIDNSFRKFFKYERVF